MVNREYFNWGGLLYMCVVCGGGEGLVVRSGVRKVGNGIGEDEGIVKGNVEDDFGRIKRIMGYGCED